MSGPTPAASVSWSAWKGCVDNFLFYGELPLYPVHRRKAPDRLTRAKVTVGRAPRATAPMKWLLTATPCRGRSRDLVLAIDAQGEWFGTWGGIKGALALP